MGQFRLQSIGRSDEWYTPPRVFNALGCKFDMDVSHPGLPHADWVPARILITENSLSAPWCGFVWMNPPFGGRNGIAPWLAKFFAHGNGIALTPDRTSAPWWQEFSAKADAVLFVSPKLKFIQGGLEQGTPAQGTSLFACGRRAVEALNTATLNGLGIVFNPGARP